MMAPKLFTPGPGGSILKAKVFGLPAPIVAVGAGVVGVIAYRHFAGGGGAAGAAGAAASSSPADYSGGTSGGDGGAPSDYSGGTGDQGSYYDQGYGGGAGAGTGIVGAGGAFVPASAPAAGGTGVVGPFLLRRVVVHKTVKVVRKKRPKGATKIVVGAGHKKGGHKITSTSKLNRGLGHPTKTKRRVGP
jgi:hypothetical protein